MRDLLVSVVINNYNYAYFVGRAIESVIGQTHAAVECIVVDDGSTDASRDVIGRYPGIKTVFKSNGGQLSAVQAGFAAASGDIVVFLDADDFLYPAACAEIAASWRPELSLLQYGLDKIDSGGRAIGSYPEQEFLAAGHLEFLLRYGYIPSSPMSGNAFSSDYLARVFAATLDTHMAADGYLIYCAPLYGRIGSVEKRLGCYRIHGRNASPAAIVNAQTLQRQLLNDIKFREGLARNIERCGFAADKAINYLGPYDFRTIILLKKSFDDVPTIKHIPLRVALAQAVRKFATYPGIPLWNRAKNILAVIVIALLPSVLVRRILSGSWAHPVDRRQDRSRQCAT